MESLTKKVADLSETHKQIRTTQKNMDGRLARIERALEALMDSLMVHAPVRDTESYTAIQNPFDVSVGGGAAGLK